MSHITTHFKLARWCLTLRYYDLSYVKVTYYSTINDKSATSSTCVLKLDRDVDLLLGVF